MENFADVAELAYAPALGAGGETLGGSNPSIRTRTAKARNARRKATLAKTQKMDTDELNRLSNKIIGIAIGVHKELGPGFVEKIYQKALIEELKKVGVGFEEEKYVKVHYKDKELGQQRIDLIIEDEIVLEMKSIEKIGNIHIAQLLSYLKTLDRKLGLILI